MSSKSQSITNADATPPVFNTAGQGAGTHLNSVNDTAETTSSDASGQIYRVVRVPADAKVKSLILDSDAMGGSSAADFGLYKTAVDGGAVVDADFFGSAVSLVSAVRASDIVNESGNYSPEKRNMRLWEAAGMSAMPPSGFLDIAATATATINTGGTIGLQSNFA
jgi:hypothetical protein